MPLLWPRRSEPAGHAVARRRWATTQVLSCALALGAVASSTAGCFHDLNDHGGLLGRHGYTPRGRHFFHRWRALVTTTNNPWDYKPLEHAVPVLNDGNERVFVGGRGGALRCFEARRGSECWRLNLDREIRGELAHQDGTLYVGVADGYLYAIDAELGKVNWKYHVKAEVLAKPLVTEDRVYVATADHTVFALDREGEWKWSYTRSVPDGFSIQGHSGVFKRGDSVYVGFADGYLVSLKAADGALQWEKKLSTAPRFTDIDATPLFAAGGLLVSCFTEGLFSLDPDDGLQRWKIPARGASSPAVADDTGYFTTPGGEIVAFAVKDGTVRWRTQLADQEGHLSDPTVYGRYVLVSKSRTTRTSSEGGVVAVDRETGRVAGVVDVGTGVHGRPIAQGGSLYFLANSGWFYAYRFAFSR